MFTFRAVRGVKNGPKWTITITSITCHISRAYDHDFWYTWWNDDISRHFFHVFNFFLYFLFLAVRGKRAKNGPRTQKNPVCCSWYLRNLISYDCHLWYTSVGVKGQKMVQSDKKICLLYSISQESCIIWFSFMELICKMIISPGVLFFFSKSYFLGC